MPEHDRKVQQEEVLSETVSIEHLTDDKLTSDENEVLHEISVLDANHPDDRNWLRRHSYGIALGLLVAGGAAGLTLNPFSNTVHQVEKVAPWTLLGIGATECLWIGGASMMAGAAGVSIGNPLTIRRRWDEISQSTNQNAFYKTGLYVNTVGAVAASGVIIAGATQLSPELWPGAAAFVALDIASTIAIRSPLYSSQRKSKMNSNIHELAKTNEKDPKVKIRHAKLSDMARLAEIDISLFEKAYGEELPDEVELQEMLTQRFNNNPEWMFVSELNGEVEGFVSAFRTSVPIEDFVSWENSTADGTLNGKVDPNGKFVYVTNMTIKHEAVVLGAEEMLLANLFANGIKDGIEYGYFVSRMPHFGRWLKANGVKVPENKSELNQLANQYFDLKEEDGKRLDPQLRMYERLGYKLKRVVADAFKDQASLDFGVLCKAYVPPINESLKKIKPLRVALAGTLRIIAKNPKLLKKVF
jgi:hypothetical protein